MKIGIFSGAFDPIHAGHLAFCESAHEYMGLDRVVLLPEGTPRGKQDVSPLVHRIAMLELAVSNKPALQLLTLKSSQFNVHETLPELRTHFRDDDLTLLLGSDVVRTFQYRWPGLDILFKEMGLLIGLRGHDTADEMRTILAAVQADVTPHAIIRYDFLPKGQHNLVASSQIRTNKEQMSQILPAVASYIAEHRLYNVAS